MNQNDHMHLFQVPPSLMTTSAGGNPAISLAAAQAQAQALAISQAQSLANGGFPVINGAQNPANASIPTTASQMNPAAAQQMAQISALLSLDQNSLLAMLGIQTPATTAQTIQNQGPSPTIGIANHTTQFRPSHTASSQPQLPQGILGPSALSTVYRQAHLFNQSIPRQPVSQPQHPASQFSPNSQQLQALKAQQQVAPVQPIQPVQPQLPSQLAGLPPQLQQQLAAAQLQAQAQHLARNLLGQQLQAQHQVSQPQVQAQQQPSQNAGPGQQELLLYMAVQEMLEKQKKQQAQAQQQQQQQQHLEVLQRLAVQEAALQQAQAQAQQAQQQASRTPGMVMTPPSSVPANFIDIARSLPATTTPNSVSMVHGMSPQHIEMMSRKRAYDMVDMTGEKTGHELASSPPKIPNLNASSPQTSGQTSTPSTTTPKKSESVEDDEVIIVDDNETMPKLTPEADVKEPETLPRTPEPTTNPLNEQIESHLLRMGIDINKEKCKPSEGQIQMADMNMLGIIATIPGHIVHKMLDDILNTTPV